MKVFITKKAQKELNKIPDEFAKQIMRQLSFLSDNPYPLNSKKLQGNNIYRLRIGSFRALYFIEKKQKEITVLRIADRKTVYR
jgi:mRNA interferase RelE/StbE